METVDDLYSADMADPRGRASRERGYWRVAVDENAPGSYAVADGSRAAFLVEMVKSLEPSPWSIFEIGCNIGRNLEALRKESEAWVLAGMDVRDCSREMAEHFPELSSWGKFIWHPAAEALPKFKDIYFDLVFSMAALMHMAEDSILVEMARISRRHIITIEIEDRGWPLFYPRNYRTVFEGLGFRQTYEQVACEEPGNRYMARLFERAG